MVYPPVVLTGSEVEFNCTLIENSALLLSHATLHYLFRDLSQSLSSTKLYSLSLSVRELVVDVAVAMSFRRFRHVDLT